MATTSISTIALTPPTRTIEYPANETLYPGHIVEIMSTGKVRKNTRVASQTLMAVALSKEYDGKGVSDAYAQDDTVVIGTFSSGSSVALRVAAGAVAITMGNVLEAVGDGTVRKQQGRLTNSTGGTFDAVVQDVTGTFSQSILNNNFTDLISAVLLATCVGIAAESVDNSGGSGEVFIRTFII